MHDDIKKWKKLVENSVDPVQQMIKDPTSIKRINDVDPEIWKNPEVKKAMLGFILKALKSKSPDIALEIYFKLLSLKCHWPDLDVVKKYLSDMSVATPDAISYYFERSGIKNREVIQQKIYEIVVEWLKKYGSSMTDMIHVSSWANKPRKWGTASTKFSPDYYDIRISFNPWIFKLYEQGLIPEDKISIVEKYADLIVDAYEQAISKYSGTDYSYNLGDISTLQKYSTKPDKLHKILYKQIGQLYQSLNSKKVTDYINSIKDEKTRHDEMKNLGELITRVLNQLAKSH